MSKMSARYERARGSSVDCHGQHWLLILCCATHLTWVKKLLCRAHAISDRLIAKLAGLHVGRQSLMMGGISRWFLNYYGELCCGVPWVRWQLAVVVEFNVKVFPLKS